MIDLALSFDLPKPWEGKRFETKRIGAINYLVGPNASGKSRFAAALKEKLPNARLLSSERLYGFSADIGMGVWGNRFDDGIEKRLFQHFRTSSADRGFALDTLILLEERLDLRVRLEATLSSLFNRRIVLEWNSGNLIPLAVHGASGERYRLDRDECHGIKELLILLTHLYYDGYDYLIIDEPELNLHPRLQIFFMQEVRAVAGIPNRAIGRKGIFLITHSPVILELRSLEDLRSVICFDLNHSVPRQGPDLDAKASGEMKKVMPRLNVQHKQLFLSEYPVFVEDSLDAQILQAVQESRGVSIAGAGSCIIDAADPAELDNYIELVAHFGKTAYLLCDLKSLFLGSLRSCLGEQDRVTGFLARMGIGNDFLQNWIALERKLTEGIGYIQAAKVVRRDLAGLRSFLERLAKGGTPDTRLGRAQLALAVHIRHQRQSIVDLLTAKYVEEIEARLGQIAKALRTRNIHMLVHGPLEHYLPTYEGSLYELADQTKSVAVASELSVLADRLDDEQLQERYTDLFSAIKALPATTSVSLDTSIRDYLSNYIAEIQRAIVREPAWGLGQVRTHVERSITGIERLFTIEDLKRAENSRFNATIRILGAGGKKRPTVQISERTNAGMMQFGAEEA